MQLRQHPLMMYRSSRNWPPVWTRIRGGQDRRPKGEVGILREVQWAPIQLRPLDRFFVVMEFDRTFFMGALLFDDREFCREIERLVRLHCGCSIKSIGDLDVDYTL
jgi:hypothetical protein